MTRESALSRLRLLKPGNYHCFLYGDEAEANIFTVSFVRQGLNKKEKIFCLTPGNNTDSLLETLGESGIDIAAAVETGQLQMETGEGVLYDRIARNPADINDHLLKEIDKARFQGYQAIRIGIDVTNRLNGAEEACPLPVFVPDSSEGFFQDRCLIVFMYNMSRLRPEVLFRVLAAYPFLIIGDDV